MTTLRDLKTLLRRLEGKGYKAYKNIRGSYNADNYILTVDHVQGDPFAAPSKLRLLAPMKIAGFPEDLFGSFSRCVGLRDIIARQFAEAARQFSKRRGSGKGGIIGNDCPGQQVLDRTAVMIGEQYLEVRFVVGLPAVGRRILGHLAAAILCEEVPAIAKKTLNYCEYDATATRDAVETCEDSDYLRTLLPERGLVSFIADGAILPRRSGIDDRPLTDNPIVFKSAPSLRVTLNCPNMGEITGMGIPRGVTLIVGGGYHGKSTLLRALEKGIYNHIPGDGRERCVCDGYAVKVRAEDGRSVAGVNISPFIKNLPLGKPTDCFFTANASGSTSQSASIMEALEAGAHALLLDEDTSATNFMIRDRRMQELIAKDKEPITPFTDKVRQLWEDHGVSTILVMGGCGDYFEAADTVIAMERYLPRDCTKQAKDIATNHQTGRQAEGGNSFGDISHRYIDPGSLNPRKGRQQIQYRVSRGMITLGYTDIDLAGLEQVVSASQSRSIALALIEGFHSIQAGETSVSGFCDHIEGLIEKKNLGVLTDRPDGDLAQFRRFELAAALNRIRSLKAYRIRN